LPNQKNTSIEEISRIVKVPYATVKRIAQLLPKTPEGGQMIYYTSDEVANIIGVHVKTVETWRREGKLPFFSLGAGTIRISRKDLMESIRKMRRIGL
jgi:excisionase family DNA binding protein